MAYNLLAELRTAPDWERLNNYCMQFSPDIEFFPIPEENSLGVSIPSQAVQNLRWESVADLLSGLRDDFSFRIFDLYSGENVTNSDFAIVKRNLFA